MRGPSGALILTIVLAIWTAFAPTRAAAAGPTLSLLLDTVINGASTNTITSFVQFPDGSMGASVRDLTSLGLKVDNGAAPDTVIKLSDLPTLTYKYNERAQQISITIDSSGLQTRVLDVRSRDRLALQTPRSDWGAMVNYDIFSAASDLSHSNIWSFGGASLTLDGRAFSPLGVIEQTAIASVDARGHDQLIRLNTTYTYSDPTHLDTWTAGDLISGSTTWSRPIRLGGFQIQSNFALRPDLVTTPLASLGGTAAVPSTVDLYVNNVRTYSQDVGSGPFSLINVPLSIGPGTAQVVIRNASGQTVTASLPFFGSAGLLAPGLDSWSVEAGLPRTSFAGASDSYEPTLVVSATWMHGASSWLTFGGHGEAGGGVFNGAADVTFKTGTLGVASAGLTESTYRGRSGSQVAFEYQTSFGGINLTAGVQRTLGDYEDLASVTARLNLAAEPSPVTYLSGLSSTPVPQINPFLYTNARAPTELDHVTASGGFGFDRNSSWSISYVTTTTAVGQASRPLTASYFRTLSHNASFSATFSEDPANRGSAGFFLGFNMSFGPRSVSTSVSAASGGATSTVQATQPLGLAPGDVGWQVRDSEGAAPFREVDGSVRTAPATINVGVQQSPAGASGTMEVTGAIVAIANRVFLSDRIDDAFAVVDAGAPGVQITSQNLPIGKTDQQGMLLAPTLRSYQNNSLEMDPSNLPVDVQIQSTRVVVTPTEHSGLMVSFSIKHDTASALVTFVDEKGVYIAAGSEGRVNGAGLFVMGYDGQAFIENLKGSNRVTIDSGDGACLASFEFRPVESKQVRVGPVTCRRATTQMTASVRDASPEPTQPVFASGGSGSLRP